MPRSSKKNSSSKDGGSHPQENRLEHRQFLIRSLERNDVDLAALTKLNRSLKQAREQILESCGELVLLDLGMGRLKLINDELHEEKTVRMTDKDSNEETTKEKDTEAEQTYALTPAQKELCVDFLWRMKLRRKLCNRLVRRLNRIAQAMDGTDVQPPVAPRYGDLRLHMDPNTVKAHAELWKRQEQAKQAIVKGNEENNEAEKEESKENDTTEATEAKESGDKSTPVEPKKPEEATSDSNTQPATETAAEEANSEKPTDTSASTPMEVDASSTKPDAPKEGAEPEPTSAPDAVASTPNAEKTPKESEVDTEKKNTAPDSPPSLKDEQHILRQYDEAYEKIWDQQLQAFKYNLSNQEVVPDYQTIKAGAGIGATTRLLSEQEREQEYRRWQAALLARIPQQPTFAELGLENRVFCLAERRKRCLEDADDNEAESPSKKAKVDDSPEEETAESEEEEPKDSEKEEETESEEKEDDKDTEMEDDDAKKEENEDPEKKTIKLEPRKKKEEEPEEKPEVVEEPKRIRPMSLAAVPSFHDQDLVRIRMVHGDLMSSSILEDARRRMAEGTNAYNTAFRVSNHLFDHRARLQQNLAFIATKNRTEIAKANNDHALKVAMAKQRWMKEKQQYDTNRIKQFLPSNWGRSAFGTQAIQNYQRRGGVAAVVGACMADIVDGAMIVAEGKLPNKKFQDFVPPASPHANQGKGETQYNLRVENELRRQINECGAKFAASEEERKRAWKKMMKTKAEIDLPSNNYGRRGRIDLSNYHQIPVPQLKGSTQQMIPHELAARAAVASYVPPKSTSLSKYSAARVRERIGSDGTVAPVTEPKKTKDGLYIRPAGRTRKGMQWDAFRGIWVPEGSPAN